MTDRDVVRRVVTLLGAAALIFGVGLIALVYAVIKSGTVDGSAVGLVTSVGTLAGTSIGALGALLVNTRTTPTGDEIERALAPLADAASQQAATGGSRRPRAPIAATDG